VRIVLLLTIVLGVSAAAAETFEQCTDRCNNEHSERLGQCPATPAAALKCQLASEKTLNKCSKSCEEADNRPAKN
jgi:hypothetical protein